MLSSTNKNNNEMLADPAVLMTSKNPSLTPVNMPSTSTSKENDTLNAILAAIHNTLTSSVVPSDGPSSPSASKQRKQRSPKRKRSKKSSQKQPQPPSAMVSVPSTVSSSSSEMVRHHDQTLPKMIASPKFRQSNRSNQSRNNSNQSPRAFYSSRSQHLTPLPSSMPVNFRSQRRASYPSEPIQTLIRPNVPSNGSNSYKRVPFSPNQFNAYQANRFHQSMGRSPSHLNPFARPFSPRYVKPGYSTEYVSQQIVGYYQRQRQTNERFKSKQIMRQSLETIFQQSFPNKVVSLHMVGSSTNGIGDNASSVDICILSRNKPIISEAHKSPTFKFSDKQVPRTIPTIVELNSGDEEEVSGKQNEQIEQSQIEEVDSTLKLSSVSSFESVSSTPDSGPKSQIENQSTVDVVVSSEANSNNDQTNDESALIVASTSKSSENNQPTETNKEQNAEAGNEILAPSTDIGSIFDPRESDLTLEMVEDLLKGKNFAKDIVSIPAKVPIIKFKDNISKLDITLNLNQDVSIRNTQLVRDYSKMDWRFPYLAMIIKQWARENRIASAIEKTISSYSWTLMVIHYLQICDPPVLPSLQKLNQRRYDHRNDIHQAINNWRRYPTRWQSHNNQNLRQLLKGLFRYYGYSFRYDQYVISIREGRVLERSSFNDESNQWNSFLCIEEPFTGSNTTRSVHDKEKFDRIVELFRMASNALRGVRISLFNVIVDDLAFPISY